MCETVRKANAEVRMAECLTSEPGSPGCVPRRTADDALSVDVGTFQDDLCLRLDREFNSLSGSGRSVAHGS